MSLATGVEDPDYDRCYCPYCGWEGTQAEFLTPAQKDYATSVAMREAKQGVDRMIKKTLGLDSRGRRRIGGEFLTIDMRLRWSPPQPVVIPNEEELRRDVICPHCTLAHAVFGLAVWCADCGKDIFLTHVAAELDVVRKVLGEVARRRQDLGPRIAARDTENALEDTVSVFEAVLKFVYRRKLAASLEAKDAEDRLRRRHSAFQNPRRAAKILLDEFGVDIFSSISVEEQDAVSKTFQKRHAIAHNLGIVDGKYLERGRANGGLGREVPLSAGEVGKTVDLVGRVLADAYSGLFSE